MLKKISYAMLLSGLLLAPLGVSAKQPCPAERDVVDYGVRMTKADRDNPFPDQSDSRDYGIRETV